jgi:DNA-binding HxlR family transcriptional regulator
MEKAADSAPEAAVPTVARMVEEMVGCKWSVRLLALVRRGVCRPGAMERAIDGLTTKVLNERLAKMVRFGILEKRSYPEVPPRVEYALTEFGERFVVILDAIEDLQKHADRFPQNRHAS